MPTWATTTTPHLEQSTTARPSLSPSQLVCLSSDFGVCRVLSFLTCTVVISCQLIPTPGMRMYDYVNSSTKSQWKTLDLRIQGTTHVLNLSTRTDYAPRLTSSTDQYESPTIYSVCIVSKFYWKFVVIPPLQVGGVANTEPEMGNHHYWVFAWVSNAKKQSLLITRAGLVKFCCWPDIVQEHADTVATDRPWMIRTRKGYWLCVGLGGCFGSLGGIPRIN